MTRRALAKAYVELMDQYPSSELAAAVAPVVAAHKIDVELLAKDISAELLIKKNVLTGTLRAAHMPSKGQVEEIQKALAKSLNVHDIHMDIILDERIIGGFVAETPAGTVDASVITMLERIEVA